MAALFMVGLFLAFLVTDIIYRKVQTEKSLAPVPASDLMIPFQLNTENMALPGGLFFHQGHTWAGIESSGTIKVGIDDFAQKILGRIDGLKLQKVGDSVAKGDKILVVQQGNRKAEFNAPVDGVISSINDEIIEKPELLKENPYEKGWIYSIQPTNLADNIKSLVINNDATNWLKKEVSRFTDFISEQFVQDKALGKTLADGGQPVDGILEQMDDFSWMKAQEEFWAK
jgi:glycine cleavage system H lipoate-binding protein